MKKNLLFIIFTLCFSYGQNADIDSLGKIRAFQFVDSLNASSGFVQQNQFIFLKNAGFKHVISLLPGDQSNEKSIVTSLGMTFTQIGVAWNDPTITDIETYFADMKKHTGEKVLVHCMANMRASAFMFLYRTTQMDVNKEKAATLMNAIWNPKENEKWNALIEQTLTKYGLGKDY